MDVDPFVTLAGLLVGFVVGLTGMGGGALMTPVLVLLFGVQPLAAVSSDLVASAVMKPVGAGVHMRRRTVNWSLVRWLVAGSVPAAFCGVLLLRALGDGEDVQHLLKTIMGVMLLLAAGSMVGKAWLDRRRTAARARAEATVAAEDGRSGKGASAAGADADADDEGTFAVRPLPTLLVGVLGGLAVGITSVGSGSLIIIMLLMLYPRIVGSQLVGTDLVQAVPLVAAASLGHLLFGDFQLGLTGSLLIGSLPGVYLGARISAGPSANRLLRPILAGVIALSGLKLVGVSTIGLGVVLGVLLAGSAAAVARRRAARPAPAPDVSPDLAGQARDVEGDLAPVPVPVRSSPGQR